LTKKDKKLLTFLILFLIAVGFTVLIFLPKVGTLSEVNAGIAEATIQKEETLLKSTKLPQLEETLKDKEKEFATLTQHFYSLMQTQEIDNLLTEKALAQGLSVRLLNIGQVEALATLEFYIGSEEAEEALSEEEEPEESEETQSANEESTDGTTAEDLANEEGGNTEETPEESEETPVNVIHQSKISITVEGSAGGIQNFVDELFNDPSILVTSWQRSGEGMEEGQEVTMINLTIFMCEVE
jgi:hypothetical protein